MNTETTKKIDWQKAILYIVIFAFIFAYGKSCSSENTAIAKSESATKKADSLSNIAGAEILKNEKLQSELADQKSQYSVIEKLVYKVSADLVKIRQNTAQKVDKVKTYTNNDKQVYFDSIYGKSEVMAVKLDSIASEVVIIDLEVGKGAIKENSKLNEKIGLLDSANKNLLTQNSNLEAQNNNSLSAYLKEKEASIILKGALKEATDELKKEVKFRLLGGFEYGNNITLSNQVLKANLSGQLRNGNIIRASVDNLRTYFIGYDFSIFSIKGKKKE